MHLVNIEMVYHLGAVGAGKQTVLGNNNAALVSDQFREIRKALVGFVRNSTERADFGRKPPCPTLAKRLLRVSRDQSAPNRIVEELAGCSHGSTLSLFALDAIQKWLAVQFVFQVVKL